MDAAGEGTSRSERRKHERGKAPAKKRKPRTQKPKPVSHLIRQLRETVFPDPDTPATKRQVLQQTKTYIQELESKLDTLLKMKDNFHSEDQIPCTLEDVKEDYVQIYCNEHSTISDIELRSVSEPAVLSHQHEEDFQETEEEPKTQEVELTDCSAPGLMEFERYMHFYKQTVDMLVENGVVATEQVTNPVVSKAISSLWQDLSQESTTSLDQSYQQQGCSTPCSQPGPMEPSSGYSCMRDSGIESQEASGSFLSSTPEEILFEDAFDIATRFLDTTAAQNTSSPSSTWESCSWGSPENDPQLYEQIAGYLQSHFSKEAKYDYETALLHCTETFDDEDL
uniref:Stimulated by retinoic acid 8 n=1 Tax=Leptobrachium leishanense TaxID=445787 RepID=A0A8C5QS47_9ANUR